MQVLQYDNLASSKPKTRLSFHRLDIYRLDKLQMKERQAL